MSDNEYRRREIYLVRHGETDWNNNGRFQGHINISLNEEGKIQAQKAYERLKTIDFDLIYSSDLERAAETARIINAHREIPSKVPAHTSDPFNFSVCLLSHTHRIKKIEV